MELRSVVGLIAVAVTVGLTGCGDYGRTAGDARSVGRADYGSDWPLTVEAGTLRCEELGAVTFTAEDGTTYWLNVHAEEFWDNPDAEEMAEERGWRSLDAIHANGYGSPAGKVSIGPLVDDGLALCE
jgi:hypothetical protein